MLIYNFQKEFLGIDDIDLKKLGFENLADLRAEAADFADLFVKTPGYIHNFKHVHWIDFVECAENSNTSNVIIHAKNRNYKSTLEIKTAFLVDSPTKPAYIIYLNNLRELSEQESEQIANDLHDRAIPQGVTDDESVIIQKQAEDEIVSEFVNKDDIFDDSFGNEEIQDDLLDISGGSYEQFEEKTKQEENITVNDIDDDFKLDIDFEEEEESEEVIEEEIKEVEIPQEMRDYVYDPQVASEELGLPLDLIDEFVGDFIAQAHDFKDKIYNAFDNDDMDEVKVLSHKLKGVAANLRIEDALETITTVNRSDDKKVVKTNLDIFYKIIDKLEARGAEPDFDETLLEVKQEEEVKEGEQEEQTEIVEQEVTDGKDNVSDEIAIDFKDDIGEQQNEQIEQIEQKAVDDKDDAPDEIAIDFKDDETQEQEQSKTDSQEDTQESEKIELDLDFDDFNQEKIEEEVKEEVKEENIQYSKEEAAKKIGLDKEVFDELFNDFKVEAKSVILDIIECIDQNDVDGWQKKASKFRSMSEAIMFDKSIEKDLSLLGSSDDASAAIDAANNISNYLEKISNL